MAHLPNTALPGIRPSDDGKWLRCPQCEDAYWGAFRPTDFIAAKLAAHVERKHKAAPEAEAGVEAPAAAQLLPKAKAPAKPKRAVAKANAKAAKKGDGPVRVVREAGPSTADLLGDAMADILADLGGDLNPRLQLGQAARNFTDQDGNRDNRARMGGRKGPQLNTRGRQALADAAANAAKIDAEFQARRVA